MTGAAKEPIVKRLIQCKTAWITLAIALAFDQGSKLAAQLTLKPDGWEPGDPVPHYEWIDGLVHGTWQLNSLITDNTPVAMQVIQLVGGVAMIAAFAYYCIALTRKDSLPQHIAGGLLLASTNSNLFDQAVFGGVRNFLRMGFDNPFWILFGSESSPDLPWLTARRSLFSPAPVLLGIGMLLMIAGLLRDSYRDRAETKPSPPPPPMPGRRPLPGRPRPPREED